MRIDTSPTADTPAGVILEQDLIARIPERRADILAAAITAREDRVLALKAAQARYGWHPVHATKVIVISALGTFVFAYLVSLIASFGHWYAQAKSLSLDVGIPVIGTQHLAVGSLVPTSTQLGIAAMIPQFGLAGAAAAAFVVAALVLIERLAAASAGMAMSQRLKTAERRVRDEIKTLKGWQKG